MLPLVWRRIHGPVEVNKFYNFMLDNCFAYNYLFLSEKCQWDTYRYVLHFPKIATVRS